jgi:hypothetical protein
MAGMIELHRRRGEQLTRNTAAVRTQAARSAAE